MTFVYGPYRETDAQGDSRYYEAPDHFVCA